MDGHGKVSVKNRSIPWGRSKILTGISSELTARYGKPPASTRVARQYRANSASWPVKAGLGHSFGLNPIWQSKCRQSTLVAFVRILSRFLDPAAGQQAIVMGLFDNR